MSDIYVKEVLMTDNDTVISASACRLVGIQVTTIHSAHTVVFEDADGVAVFTLPDTQLVGPVDMKSCVFPNGLSVSPEDAATGGIFLVFYQPLPLGKDIFGAAQ